MALYHLSALALALLVAAATALGDLDFPSTDHPFRNYNGAGTRFGNLGDIESAEPNFRAATVHSPHRADVWNNLGMATHDNAIGAMQGGGGGGGASYDKTAVVQGMRESLAAHELADALGHRGAAAQVEQIENMWEQNSVSGSFGAECQATDCAWYNRLRDAQENGECDARGRCKDHAKAVSTLCPGDATGEAVKVRLSAAELRSGHLNAESARRIWWIMRICGVVAVPGVYDTKFVEKVRAAQDEHFSAFLKKQEGKKLEHMESEDAAARSAGRYEVRLPVEAPFTDAALVENGHLLQTILMLLADKFEIDTFSTVTSVPGAPDQHHHADVSHLFMKEVVLGTDRHTPPFGLVAVVPLQNVDLVNGPTEFTYGSHVMVTDKAGNEHWQAADEWPEGRGKAPITADAGDFLLFDLRIRHRGRGNNSKMRRAIIYVGFVADWYKDPVNFKEKQSRKWDSLRPASAPRCGMGMAAANKIFRRVDSQEYVKNLEQALEAAAPGKLKQLTSQNMAYHSVDLAVSGVHHAHGGNEAPADSEV